MDGHELLVRRYSLLQQLTFSEDSFTVKVAREELGPLHGHTLHMHVSTNLVYTLTVGISLPLNRSQLLCFSVVLPLGREKHTLPLASTGLIHTACIKGSVVVIPRTVFQMCHQAV